MQGEEIAALQWLQAHDGTTLENMVSGFDHPLAVGALVWKGLARADSGNRTWVSETGKIRLKEWDERQKGKEAQNDTGKGTR